MRLLRLSSAIFLVAASLQAADPAPAEPKKEAEKSEDFSVPVPLGIPVKGIKIPHRNAAGKLVMTIEADVAKKIDEHQVEMENMKIESFDDDGKTLVMEVPHSIFNLDTRMLVGDSKTWIRRADFEITGDSVEFNTKTRFATMRGNIRMIMQSGDIEK